MSGFGDVAYGLFRDWLTENSASYQSFNGNGTRQNLFGAQITNSFGSSLTAQLDMVRLWKPMDIVDKDIDYVDSSGAQQTKTIANYADFDKDTITSRILGALRALGAGNYQYFTQKSGIWGLRTDSAAESFAVNWNGYLTLMLGDSAQMNFKGDLMSISRAVNTITYASDIDKQRQWNRVDCALKSFYYYVYCLSVLMKNIFDVVVEQYSSSMSQAATLVVEIIETVFLIFIPYYQNKWSKELLWREKEFAHAYIADDSETAVMQDEFKKNSKTLSDLIDANTTKLKELEAAKGVLESDISAYQTELAKLKSEVTTYQESVKKSQSEVDALKSSLKDLEDDFKARTDGLVSDLQALQEKLEEDRAGFTSSLSGLSEEYNKKLAELNSIVEIEMEKLDKLKSDTDAKIAELDSQYKASLVKFEEMVAKGTLSSILGQVGAMFQIKASQINMTLQGYSILQQEIMIAIQEQKCAKVFNKSISTKVVETNIGMLVSQLSIIRRATDDLNEKLSNLASQEDKYIAQIQTAAGMNLAATNGDAATDLNPAAAGIAAILEEITAGIDTEQTAMNEAIEARCDIFNATLERCTKLLGKSASRSVGVRAAHKTTKVAQDVANKLNPFRYWRGK